MTAYRSFALISDHCDAIESVAWFLFGSPRQASRVAGRLAEHLEDW